MQTVPIAWARDDLGQGPSLACLLRRPDTFGGVRKRCRRCDIPLGSQRCPNPQCREPHGQSAGDLCAWCHQQREALPEVLHGAALPDSLDERWWCATAPLDGGAGPRESVPRTDPGWEPGDDSGV